jgi:hypothetical protein
MFVWSSIHRSFTRTGEELCHDFRSRKAIATASTSVPPLWGGRELFGLSRCTFVTCTRCQALCAHLYVYSETQSICIETGCVGHSRSKLQNAICSKSSVMGCFVISFLLVMRPHT